MRVKLNTAIYIHNVGSIPFGKEAELDDKLAKELIAIYTSSTFLDSNKLLDSS